MKGNEYENLGYIEKCYLSNGSVALVSIEATTKPNNLILAPFAGSGTTLVAALQSGHRFEAAFTIKKETT